MEYELRIFAIGENPNNRIVISEDEFNALKESRNILAAGLAIEEKYEILLTNYEDFEKELLNSALESELKRPRDYSDFRFLRVRCNTRIINLVTACRLYIDHTMQHVHDIIPVEAEGTDLIKQFRSEKYDANLEYRFMEKLRNYVQHNSFPIDNVSVKGWAVGNNTPNRKWARTIELICDKNVLVDSNFNKTVLAELEDKIYLKQMIRKYIECLSEVQGRVRSMLSDRLSTARGRIAEYITRFRNEVKENTNGLYALAYDDDRQRKDKIPILLGWDDLRISLEQKNAVLTNISKCYVTGELRKI